MLCSRPTFFKSAGGLVTCKQCMPCRIRKRREWTLRLILEGLSFEHNAFVTLTYNNDAIPKQYIHPKTGEIFSGATLNPDHVQRFIKRLRDRLDYPIRVFYVGEYGDDTARPHYHLILFNYHTCYFGRTRYKYGFKNCCPSCDFIRDLWHDKRAGFNRLGNVDLGTFTYDSAQYTCGYTIKKMTSKDDDRLLGRYPEFRFSSQGIGAAALPSLCETLASEAGMDYFYENTDIPRVLKHNGKKWPLGKYLRDKILLDLKVSDDAKLQGFQKYQEEMRRLQKASEINPLFRNSAVSQEILLAHSHMEENRQKLINAESRSKLFQKGKKI